MHCHDGLLRVPVGSLALDALIQVGLLDAELRWGLAPQVQAAAAET